MLLDEVDQVLLHGVVYEEVRRRGSDRQDTELRRVIYSVAVDASSNWRSPRDNDDILGCHDSAEWFEY